MRRGLEKNTNENLQIIVIIENYSWLVAVEVNNGNYTEY